MRLEGCPGQSMMKVFRAPTQGRMGQEQQDVGYVQGTDQRNKCLKGKESRFLTAGASSDNYDGQKIRVN